MDGTATPFARVEVKVTADGPALGGHAVVKALQSYLTLDEDQGTGLGTPEEVVNDKTGYSFTVPSAGRWFFWQWLGIVEADYTYTCTGTASGTTKTVGHVVTWETPGSGFTACTEKLDSSGDATADTMARAAAEKVCAAGDAALA
jgi:hypothetical protein